MYNCGWVAQGFGFVSDLAIKMVKRKMCNKFGVPNSLMGLVSSLYMFRKKKYIVFLSMSS